MADAKIQELEMQIFELNMKLIELRKDSSAIEVSNYTFQTQNGDTNLLELFGDNDRLLLIHNMGQGCRYCTLCQSGERFLGSGNEPGLYRAKRAAGPVSAPAYTKASNC